MAYAKAPGAREDNWVWCATGAVDAHVPHKYGLVRFAAAAAGTPAAAALLAAAPTPPPPSSWPARAALMTVYEAQARRARRGAPCARTLEELSEGDAAYAAAAAAVAAAGVTLLGGDDAGGFEAVCRVPDSSDALFDGLRGARSSGAAAGGEPLLHVRRDGLLWATW